MEKYRFELDDLKDLIERAEKCSKQSVFIKTIEYLADHANRLARDAARDERSELIRKAGGAQ